MPLTREQLDQQLGSFHYQELPGGKLQIDQAWTDARLVYIDCPWPLALGWGGYAGRIRCHRRVSGQLLSALRELKDGGLTSLIDTFDGAWVARLVRGGNTPSPHCWGHALDLNASEFPLGSDKQQDPRLVPLMARYGFECGQVWQHRKDPMHFEAIRFLDSPVPSGAATDDVSILVGGRKVTTGRLETGHVVGPIAPVAEELGRRVTWDGPNRRLIIE
ncbi:MAG: M15 family metallopeptidase [Armatimonadota bacterium]